MNNLLYLIRPFFNKAANTVWKEGEEQYRKNYLDSYSKFRKMSKSFVLPGDSKSAGKKFKELVNAFADEYLKPSNQTRKNQISKFFEEDLEDMDYHCESLMRNYSDLDDCELYYLRVRTDIVKHIKSI